MNIFADFKRFWISWVITTFLGVVISVLILIIFITNDLVKVEVFKIPLSFIILSGTIIATVQWRVLRQRIPKAAWWIPAHLVGSYIGACTWLITLSHWEIIPLNLSTILSLSAYGFVMAIAQWIVLSQSISKAFWWIPFNTFSFPLGLTITSFFDPFTTLFSWNVLLIINGFVQATILVYLLKINRTHQHNRQIL